MLFERKFEERTRGLVCGVPTLVTPTLGVPLVTPIQRAKRGQLFIADAKPLVTEWRPWLKHYKVVMRAREGGEIIWQRAFATQQEAVFCYASLTGLQFEPGRRYHLPPIWLDGEVEIVLAIVATFNSTNTNNTLDWANGGNLTPANTSTCGYLCIAGGGGGGGMYLGGGGGAGGYRTATGFAVTPGASNTITIGAGGSGSKAGGTGGSNGSNSVFSSITSTGGGKGGSFNANGNSGGSGGGSSGSATSGAAGTSGQGNAGGGGRAGTGGGGGGASAVGGASTPTGGAGGNGSASSITGSSVTRAGGGGGGSDATGGAGGTGGGGAGASYGPSGGSSGTANTGGGGGGGGGGDSNAGFGGGSGVIILSWTPSPSGSIPFGIPFMP